MTHKIRDQAEYDSLKEAGVTPLKIVRQPINGTTLMRHHFDDAGTVITEWCEYTHHYVAWLDNQDGEQDQAQGFGSTRLEAIADLNEVLVGE